MEIQELFLKGAKLVRCKPFHDDRGFFWESYRQPLYQELGITSIFVQDNLSSSKKGTLRGMHFQRKPGQAKLVSVLQGEIFDVVVDIRPDSPTFGQWEGVRLSAQRPEQLFVPIGFAHGFCVLSETAQVFYKVSSVYDPAEEKGFRFNDPAVGIQWPITDPLLSARDALAPYMEEALA